MSDLFCAALTAISICLGFHDNGLAIEGRVFFGEAEKQVRQQLQALEEQNMWRRVEYRNRMENQFFELSREVRELK